MHRLDVLFLHDSIYHNAVIVNLHTLYVVSFKLDYLNFAKPMSKYERIRAKITVHSCKRILFTLSPIYFLMCWFSIGIVLSQNKPPGCNNNELAAIPNSKSVYIGERIKAVKQMGESRRDIYIDCLIHLLEHESNAYIINEAAIAIGEIAGKLNLSLDALSKLLGTNHQQAHQSTAQAIEKIGKKLVDEQKTEYLSQFRSAYDAIDNRSDNDEIRTIASNVAKQIKTLENSINPIVILIDNNHEYFFMILIVAIVLSINIIIFLFFPEKIININKSLKSKDIKIAGITFSLRYLFGFGFANYHPRVLDAWITSKIVIARKNFSQKKTVVDRARPIPIPVKLDNKSISELRGLDLRHVFGDQGPGVLVIWGEGGTGKTSLACQIGQWCMVEEEQSRIARHLILPVLIEEELDDQDLPEAILGNLQRLVQDSGDSHPTIDKALLHELLRTRRIMVIIDHMSEYSMKTRKKIRPNSANFPVGALIVTSRIDESLGDTQKRRLTPMKIDGDYLFEFMNSYFIFDGVRDLFNDKKFKQAAERIASFLEERAVTVLFVKLFLDEIIRIEKNGLDWKQELPKNIPELMVNYIRSLNNNINNNNFTNFSILQDCQIVAWQCIKENYHSFRAHRQKVIIPALKSIKTDNAEDRLLFLSDKLKIIELIKPKEELVRFNIDPLAEYLAAIHVVQQNGDNCRKWSCFFSVISKGNNSPLYSKGFMLAIYDAILANREEKGHPDVPKEIEQRCRKLAMLRG